MRAPIGVDLGDRWSRYCIVDSAGTVAKEDRARTTPETLEECFRKIPPSRIVIETFGCSVCSVDPLVLHRVDG